MPLLMIDIPTEEFMELRLIAKENNLALPGLINRMLKDIANKSKRDREEKAKPKSMLYLPQ